MFAAVAINMRRRASFAAGGGVAGLCPAERKIARFLSEVGKASPHDPANIGSAAKGPFGKCKTVPGDVRPAEQTILARQMLDALQAVVLSEADRFAR